MSERLNLFSQHYSEKYGEAVGKISFDTGHPCPNRAKGGCIYCSPASFTPYYLNRGTAIGEQLSQGLKFLKKRKVKCYFAYFQQETCTAAPLSKLLECFKAAMSGPGCIGLIVSTRPDFLNTNLLVELNRLARDREVIVEIGLQSAHNRSLRLLNRNHSFQDFTKACKNVLNFGLGLGVHLILGLPGEEDSDMLTTVKKVCASGVQAIKFHHLQVIRQTKLAKMLAENPFPLFTAVEYMETLAELLAQVPRTVVIHRLWSYADSKLLVEPWWWMDNQELHALLNRVLDERDLYQGKRYDPFLALQATKTGDNS